MVSHNQEKKKGNLLFSEKKKEMGGNSRTTKSVKNRLSHRNSSSEKISAPDEYHEYAEEDDKLIFEEVNFIYLINFSDPKRTY